MLSLLIRKYPLREYCDFWNWVIIEFLTPKLQDSNVRLWDLITHESLRKELLDCLVGIAENLSFLKPMTSQFIVECVQKAGKSDQGVTEALRLVSS